MKYKIKMLGFSLVEVLIALSILGLGLAALIKLHSIMLMHSEVNQQKSTAILLAENQLTTLQQISLTKKITSGQKQITQHNTEYQITWTILSRSKDITSTIQVMVNWQNALGQSQQIKLTY